MSVPSPAVATAIGDAFEQAARDVLWADVGISGARQAVTDAWHGAAATAALEVLAALDRQTTEVQAALHSTASSWHGLSTRLRLVQLAEEAITGWTVGATFEGAFSALQAGLDPAADAATAATVAARQAAIRAARAALDRAIAEIVEVCTSRRAALLAIRKVAIWGAKAVGVQAVKNAAGTWFVTGDVGWLDVVPPSILLALTPAKIANGETIWGAIVDPLLPSRVPAAFGSPDRYAAAVRAADDWAADATDHALVGIAESTEGEGVTLTVVGGEVAARSGLTVDQPYTAADLPPAMSDLAELLDEIGVQADGTVTVVVR